MLKQSLGGNYTCLLVGTASKIWICPGVCRVRYCSIVFSAMLLVGFALEQLQILVKYSSMQWLVWCKVLLSKSAAKKVSGRQIVMYIVYTSHSDDES